MSTKSRTQSPQESPKFYHLIHFNASFVFGREESSFHLKMIQQAVNFRFVLRSRRSTNLSQWLPCENTACLCGPSRIVPICLCGLWPYTRNSLYEEQRDWNGTALWCNPGPDGWSTFYDLAMIASEILCNCSQQFAPNRLNSIPDHKLHVRASKSKPVHQEAVTVRKWPTRS